MALVTTVSGETSDSYVSVGDADRYFRNHYSLTKTSTWDGLSSGQKESALRRACQQLETLAILDDVVTKLVAVQRLQFPRSVDVDSLLAGYIPPDVKDAQCEQAVHLLTFDDSVLIQAGSGIVEDAVTAGPIKTYTRYTEFRIPTYLSPMVVELMRPFFRMTTRMERA